MGRLSAIVLIGAVVFGFAATMLAASLQEFQTPPSTDVLLHFDRGDIALDTFAKGAELFANQESTLLDFPSEMEGLSFTRHKVFDGGDVTAMRSWSRRSKPSRIFRLRGRIPPNIC